MNRLFLFFALAFSSGLSAQRGSNGGPLSAFPERGGSVVYGSIEDRLSSTDAYAIAGAATRRQHRERNAAPLPANKKRTAGGPHDSMKLKGMSSFLHFRMTGIGSGNIVLVWAVLPWVVIIISDIISHFFKQEK